MKRTEIHILLIDDEPDTLEFLSYNFRKNGFRVQSAANGREGLERVREEKFDVIIADILMPVLDGISFCRILKNDPLLCCIPVIFLSATQDDYKVMAGGIAGADHYISKPVRFPLLLNIVLDVLSEIKKDV
jgi:two-component system alkaline phosphatase synthesis response regulator PhoP